jgi:hypothetical protein
MTPLQQAAGEHGMQRGVLNAAGTPSSDSAHRDPKARAQLLHSQQAQLVHCQWQKEIWCALIALWCLWGHGAGGSGSTVPRKLDLLISVDVGGALSGTGLISHSFPQNSCHWTANPMLCLMLALTIAPAHHHACHWA